MKDVPWYKARTRARRLVPLNVCSRLACHVRLRTRTAPRRALFMRHAVLRLMTLGNHDHLGNVSAQIACVPWRPLHRQLRFVPPLQTAVHRHARHVPRTVRAALRTRRACSFDAPVVAAADTRMRCICRGIPRGGICFRRARTSRGAPRWGTRGAQCDIAGKGVLSSNDRLRRRLAWPGLSPLTVPLQYPMDVQYTPQYPTVMFGIHSMRPSHSRSTLPNPHARMPASLRAIDKKYIGMQPRPRHSRSR